MIDSTTSASPTTSSTKSLLEESLRIHFAPWVQDLGLRVESINEGSVTLRLPHSDRLARVGGMVCGQALMAVADTAMVSALIAHFGEFKACTTVQLNTSFLRPLSNQDALVEATVVRAGKTLTFGEIDIRGAKDGKSVCRATTIYALL